MQNLGLLLGPAGVGFGPVTGLPLDLGAHLSTFAGLAAILGVLQVSVLQRLPLEQSALLSQAISKFAKGVGTASAPSTLSKGSSTLSSSMVTHTSPVSTGGQISSSE